MFPLRLSTPAAEGTLRVSKALKHQVLLDLSEMQDLLAVLDPFTFYCTSEVVSSETAVIAQADFLKHYARYINELKEGRIPEEASLKRYFSAALSVTPDVFYGMQVGEGRFLVKPLKPVIQMQLHHFFVSAIDGKFHTMVLGEGSVTWGIQFSYPQIYQDPKTHTYAKIREGEEFPNTALFLRLARWLRQATSPTPFLYNHVRTNVPIRLGKKCFSWINHHPELASRGLSVARQENVVA